MCVLRCRTTALVLSEPMQLYRPASLTLHGPPATSNQLFSPPFLCSVTDVKWFINVLWTKSNISYKYAFTVSIQVIPLLILWAGFTTRNYTQNTGTDGYLNAIVQSKKNETGTLLCGKNWRWRQERKHSFIAETFPEATIPPSSQPSAPDRSPSQYRQDYSVRRS